MMVFRGALLSGTVFPTINVFKGVILRRASQNVIFMSLIKNIFHGSLHIIRSTSLIMGSTSINKRSASLDFLLSKKTDLAKN